jgi:hypothetical protein|tara:strand:- start:2243 stop:2881 length:639 start_codon:yes stop_codon:yes gene_type:complete
MGQLNQAIKIKNVLKFYDIKNFVETGTGIGEVVRSVCEIDQNINIHTIEIIEEIYDKNKISLSYLDNVNWHLGQSSDVLPDIVPSLQGSTLFWMDAHFPGADFGLAEYGDEKNIDKRLPLKSELEIIVKNKDVSNDVFIIDDLRIYEDGPFEAGVWKDRSKYGGDGIEFIEELFEETHYVVKSYNQQGYIMLFPVNKDIKEEASNLVVGSVE